MRSLRRQPYTNVRSNEITEMSVCDCSAEIRPSRLRTAILTTMRRRRASRM